MKFQIRKFYDTSVDEGVGGGEAAVIEQKAPASIAEAMAKHGVKNSGMDMVATPINIGTKEVKEEVVKEEKPASAATATKVETPETAKSETKQEAKVEKKEEVVETKKEETTKPQPTFDEVLKTQPKNAVFKALGLNDKTISLLDEVNGLDDKTIGLLLSHKEGKVADYLRELSTDYNKMTSEEVMRHQLRLDYPKANQKQLDALFNKEVVDAYNLDSDDDDEKETGQMLLDAKAEKYRDGFIEKQKDFLVPKYEPKSAEVPDNSKEIEAENKRFETYKATVNDNPVIKDIMANKAVVFGEGDEKFTFKVEKPEDITNVLFDTNKWLETQFEVEKGVDGKITKVGEPKTENQMLTALVALYGKDFLNAYAKHYKSLGGKSVVKTIDNAKETDTDTATKSEKQPTTPAEFMARQGQLNHGGRGY